MTRCADCQYFKANKHLYLLLEETDKLERAVKLGINKKPKKPKQTTYRMPGFVLENMRKMAGLTVEELARKLKYGKKLVLDNEQKAINFMREKTFEKYIKACRS